MNSFIKKVVLFHISFFFLVGIVYFFSGSSKKNYTVDKKILFFKTFSNKYEKMNLILGSSLARQAINPAIFGENWFIFSNPSQHINDSKLFLKNIVKHKNIDTLIVTINPFDFSNISPLINGQSRINQLFIDSTLIYSGYEFKKFQFQKVLEEYFISPELLFNKIKSLVNKEKKYKGINRILKNGHKYKKWKTSNLNNLNKNQINIITSFPADVYYKDIPNGLNKKYFNNFIEEAKNITSNIIFIITPKSKYYNEYVSQEYSLVHSQLLKYFEICGYNFYDFSNLLNTDSNYFNDNVHLSFEGINYFSKIVKKYFTNNNGKDISAEMD